MTVAYPRKLRNNLSARDILKQVVSQREIHLVTLNRYRYNEQRSCKDLTELIEKLNGNPPEMISETTSACGLLGSYYIRRDENYACENTGNRRDTTFCTRRPENRPSAPLRQRAARRSRATRRRMS